MELKRWLSRWLSGSEVSERFLDRGEVGKHTVQGGQLQHHPHLLIRCGQPEVALGAANQLERRDDRAQAGAVDEADAFQVDDQTEAGRS